jgi:hypothetical protein
MWECKGAKHALLVMALSSITGCTTVTATPVPEMRMMADGQTFTLHPGDMVMLADRSRLRYQRVTADSRCPPDVQCIWAGDAEVSFEWLPANATSTTFSLHTGKEPRLQRIGERTLTLLSLERGDMPDAQLRIERGIE